MRFTRIMVSLVVALFAFLAFTSCTFTVFEGRQVLVSATPTPAPACGCPVGQCKCENCTVSGCALPAQEPKTCCVK